MCSTASKVSWSKFSNDFDRVASFYYDGHFTKVNADGLVYCYRLDDYMDCESVFAVMRKWGSIYVFYDDADCNFIGMTFNDINA